MNKQSIKIFVFMTLLISISLSQVPTGINEVSALPVVPYTLGKWTYVGKAISPIKVNDSQIVIGANYTFVCNLRAGSKYHVYFYGEWIDPTPLVDKTDYDIYVYNPFGQLESMHTESAGLPEHLGTTVNEPFFVPKYTGNYSILVKNDAKESRGKKGGTLMIIEHIECNQWYEIHMQGKVNGNAMLDTCWAYEFTTTSGRVEIPVIVPDPPEAYLDMYEVQLYLMANPSEGIGTMLNGVPLPWEPGLYGDATGSGAATYGGYRLTAEGFSHANASASCEYYGQDMFIDYSSGLSDNPSRLLLYHLALIAEEGEGNVRFMFKTDFNTPTLNIVNPIYRANSDEDIDITAHAIDGESGMKSVILNYTINNWINWTAIDMIPSVNNTFMTTIPKQLGGKTVKYKVTAMDMAENTITMESSYAVKNKSYLYITLSKTSLQGGDSTQIVGWLSRGIADVTLDFVWQGTHTLKIVQAAMNGSFIYEFTPDKAGNWTVSASWLGDQEWWEASSESCSFVVQKLSTSITCSIGHTALYLGEDLDVTGYVFPAELNIEIIVSFTKPDGTMATRQVYTSSDGSYELLAFQPNLKGQWEIQAEVNGDEFHQPSNSSTVSLAVNDTWFNEYKIYIIGAGGVAGIVALGIFLLTRGKAEVEEE
jgi:hypothetical protein